MTRKEIVSQMKANQKQIEKLQAANTKLAILGYQVNDKNSRYEEKIEKQGKGKKTIIRMIGRVYWTQLFLDEGTGKKHPIERSKIVRENGVWIVGRPD